MTPDQVQRLELDRRLSRICTLGMAALFVAGWVCVILAFVRWQPAAAFAAAIAFGTAWYLQRWRGQIHDEMLRLGADR